MHLPCDFHECAVARIGIEPLRLRHALASAVARPAGHPQHDALDERVQEGDADADEKDDAELVHRYVPPVTYANSLPSYLESVLALHILDVGVEVVLQSAGAARLELEDPDERPVDIPLDMLAAVEVQRGEGLVGELTQEILQSLCDR
ncbi:MAG TPA: hypothetical protein VF403_13405 [Kofleriaceae bacterium]